jgi:hypothetical protein
MVSFHLVGGKAMLLSRRNAKRREKGCLPRFVLTSAFYLRTHLREHLHHTVVGCCWHTSTRALADHFISYGGMPLLANTITDHFHLLWGHDVTHQHRWPSSINLTLASLL